MGKQYSADAGNYIFYWPLASKNIKKLKTGRTDMKAIRNRIRDLCSIHIDKKFGIDKVRMIC
ncbi:MAG: hypothetical protein ACPL6D_13020 [Thermodesulfobacteriota bacterium]